MADNDALLQALSGAMYQRESDPFGIAASAIQAAAPLLTSPYASSGRNAGYTAGAALLAGLLGGIGQNRVDSRNQEMFGQVQRGLNDPSLWGSITQENPRLTGLANALMVDQQQRQAAANQKLQEKLQDKLLDQGKVYSGGSLTTLFDPTADAAAKAEAEAAAKIRGEMAGYGISAEQNPASPQYKAKKDTIGISESLRKEFSGQDVVKDFKRAEIGLRSLAKAMQDPAATSDVEIIRAAIQAIEPGLAVRTDDQTAIAQSVSIPDSMKAELSRALTGKSGLAPEVRSGLMRIAARRYHEYASEFNQIRGGYKSIAERQKLNPDDVLLYPQAEDVKAIIPLGFDVPPETQNQPPSVLDYETWKAQRLNQGGSN